MPAEKLIPSKAYPGPFGRFYKWTGEKRPPRKGEFYLSGSIISAYQSLGDMSYPYHIAVEVPRPKCPHCQRFV
jgi:hypothetical protein